MRKPIRILLISALLVAASGALSAAHAHSFWDVGASFHVGGFGFSFGFVKPYGHHHYHPGYYYRVGHRLDYPGYRCTDYCFRRDRAYYHYESCPVVGAHFRHYRYAPSYGYWAPHYGYRSYGHGYGYDHGRAYGHGYRDRYHKYRKPRGRDHGYRGRDYRGHGRDYGYRGGGRDDRGRDRAYRGRPYDRDDDSDSDRRHRRRRARPRPY